MRQFVIADLCAIAAGVLLCLGIYLWVLASPWMLGLAAVVAADGVVIASTTRLLSRSQHTQAATVICAGTWATALGVTLIAPMILPIMALAAQMPVILALPYLTRRRLRAFLMLTVSCIFGLGMLARLQDMSGLSTQAPDQLQDAVIITSLPVLAGLILLIVWHNWAAPRSAADAATTANSALLASQQLLTRRAEELAASRARLVAATATISASHDGTLLAVTISDDGAGFDPTATAQGSGLTNMADRVAAVGGNLHIESHCLEGTNVMIIVPTSGS